MENNVTDKTGIRKITKWIIGVVTVCILIYLAIRHLDMIAAGISWFFRPFQFRGAPSYIRFR